MDEKFCVLRPDELCRDCGDCEMCDIHPNQVCTNCMQCLKLSDADYLAIEIDEIIEEEE